MNVTYTTEHISATYTMIDGCEPSVTSFTVEGETVSGETYSSAFFDRMICLLIDVCLDKTIDVVRTIIFPVDEMQLLSTIRQLEAQIREEFQ